MPSGHACSLLYPLPWPFPTLVNLHQNCSCCLVCALLGCCFRKDPLHPLLNAIIRQSPIWEFADILGCPWRDWLQGFLLGYNICCQATCLLLCLWYVDGGTADSCPQIVFPVCPDDAAGNITCGVWYHLSTCVQHQCVLRWNDLAGGGDSCCITLVLWGRRCKRAARRLSSCDSWLFRIGWRLLFFRIFSLSGEVRLEINRVRHQVIDMWYWGWRELVGDYCTSIGSLVYSYICAVLHSFNGIPIKGHVPNAA